MKRIFLLALLLLSTPALAEPCGALTLRDGHVVLESPLLLENPLSQNTLACVDQVATALLARPNLRSVTVSARVSDDQRLALGALSGAQTVAAHLVQRGIPEFRVSALAPSAPADAAPELHILFTERPRNRPVALVQHVEGQVFRGEDAEREVLEANAPVFALDRIETGTDAAAWLVLADGSQVKLWQQSILRIGAIELDENLERRVRLELELGDLETLVTPTQGNASSFQIGTRTAIAGVRGTTFRLHASADLTRLETLEGLVELGGSQGTVEVPEAFGSRVDTTGAPEEPRPLLPPVMGLSPQTGAMAPSDVLTWAPLEGAATYRVELAREPDFYVERVAFTTPVAEMALPSGAGGTWYWRVTALDADGFSGYDSQVFAIEIQDPSSPNTP